MNAWCLCAAAVAVSGWGMLVQAGPLGFLHPSDKCDTATCVGTPCRPTIERPCYEIVRTYQRAFAAPPAGCDTCAPTGGPLIAWPAPPGACDVTGTGGCDSGCDSELAELICQSKTACYAHQRRTAVRKIGTRFSCHCHPQVMPALVYALNDADETVRSKAADQIGDQLRESPQCAAPYVVCALKLSLADCDHLVRCEAEQALRLCGYEIVSSSGKCPPASQSCPPTAIPPAPASSSSPMQLPPAPAEAAPVDAAAVSGSPIPAVASENAAPLNVKEIAAPNLFHDAPAPGNFLQPKAGTAATPVEQVTR